MTISTQPPSGFRDFLGPETKKRNELVQKISQVYESFGFEPIETPALENLNVLLGSGGQENEKLLFHILKRKEKLEKALQSIQEDSPERQLADLALRFDLTVPLCRLVAQYQNDIKFPWKVFHIAPVWRAERPQRGRYREFYQCDVDLVGAEAPGAELEVLQAVCAAFAALGFGDLKLKLNDRRIIEAFAKKMNLENKLTEFAILLDKKDKLPEEKIYEEIKALMPKSEPNGLLQDILGGQFYLEKVRELCPEAYEEIFQIEETASRLPLPVEDIVFDASLVRGMGYYTGAVFEITHEKEGFALAGGGRYDKLIGRFSKNDFPAVGMSIGFERLLLLLEESSNGSSSRKEIFLSVLDEHCRAGCLKLAKELREKGLAVSVYPGKAKAQKQMKYASAMNYRWVIIAGSEEIESRVFKVKDFETGEEVELKQGELGGHLLRCLA